MCIEILLYNLPLTQESGSWFEHRKYLFMSLDIGWCPIESYFSLKPPNLKWPTELEIFSPVLNTRKSVFQRCEEMSWILDHFRCWKNPGLRWRGDRKRSDNERFKPWMVSLQGICCGHITEITYGDMVRWIELYGEIIFSLYGNVILFSLYGYV